MKEVNNNEMDLLLRSLAGGARPRAESIFVDGDHLDADELNAFAEGVMPEPARARYTEHLADCDSCRSLVVSLSQAHGSPAALTVPETRAQGSFWQTLSAVFSPAVLRFAVPALVLTLVIGVGLFALRQQQQSEFIAQNRSAESVAQAPEPVSSVSPEAATNEAPARAANAVSSPQTREEKADKTTFADRVAEGPAPPGADIGVAERTLSKDGLAAGERADLDTVRSYPAAKAAPSAGQPNAAAPPAPLTMTGSNTQREQQANEVAEAKREDQRRDQFRYQKEEEHGPNRSRAQNQAPSVGTGRSAGGLMSANRGPSDAAKNKASNVESRSVAGRYFVREGNAWVDSEYDSGRATIRVARGSEQYRGLIADEPAIRTIAEQLSGVVIVVWKSRAYRIQ